MPRAATRPTTEARRRVRRLRRARRNRRIKRWRDHLPPASAVAAAARRAGRRALPGLVAVAVMAAVAGAAALAVGWLTQSPRFAVAAIRVSGCERLRPDRVRALAGVIPGTNVFRVDPDQVRRRLERDPWIARADVARRLPNALDVSIVERRAAAVVELGALYLADADGRPFKRAAIDRGEGRGLPVVTGIARTEYLADPAGAQARIRRALAIADAYRRSADRPPLGEVHLGPDDGVTLFAYDRPLALRLGTAADRQPDDRLAAFDAAWRALDPDERAGARIVFLDNETNPNRITVRFGGTN